MKSPLIIYRHLRFLFLFVLVLSLGLTVRAQDLEVDGITIDGQTGKKLENVNIVLRHTWHGTSTDSLGRFKLTVDSGQYALIATHVGYKKYETEINVDTSIHLNIVLWPDKLQLAEVSIEYEPIPPQAYHSTNGVKLSAKEITAIPSLFGEPDVLKTIQLLPGVQGGTEGTSGFYVRGGSPDQNLILLDGVPVYNASHLFGFFSTFNSDIIEDVELLKGGFPARYGGRLSSVLNINLREGNMNEFHGEGSLSLIAPKLLLEGPIVKGKTSFIISGRRSIYDLVVVPFYADGEQLYYYFGDFNAKLKHIINERNEIVLSYFHSRDRFKYKYEELPAYAEQSGINWKNHTVAANWKHTFSPKLTTNLLASFNHYKFNTYSEQTNSGDVFSLDYLSLIEDVSLRYDLSYQLTKKHHLRFGSGYTYHTFKPGALQLAQEYDQTKIQQQQDLSRPIFSNDFSAYAEDTWRISTRWQINGGLHYGVYKVQNSTYTSLQPRLSAHYNLSENWILSGSYAEMTQFLHLLSNTGLGVPTDLWVSATDKVKPQQSQQYALGSTKYFSQKAWEFTTEVYYKSMQNLIEYKEGASYLTLTDWQNVVETDGTGEAYGLEVLLRKSKGKTTGWIAYTLASTTRTFENLNDGKTFPYRYDRRHDLSVVLNHRFNKKIDVSANWVYQSGIAFTAPTALFLANAGESFSPFHSAFVYEVEQLSDRNAYRYPAYHRLDLGINFTKKKKWGSRVINISIYNTYNRVNPFFIDIKPDKGGNPKATMVGLFPILPSISYAFKF